MFQASSFDYRCLLSTFSMQFVMQDTAEYKNNIQHFKSILFDGNFLKVTSNHRVVHHGLCGSNKQLYKRCAKSMGRPKFRPPQLPHFSTDLNETRNQERYPGYDPTCKIWIMWDDGKGVCVGRAFSVTFCVLSFFCILAHAYRSHQKTDHDHLWLKKRVSA